ncbi:MAG: alanine--glyoxylate aminotransferase family protein [Clostridium sp.]|uniref:pyridoxal-phosphate-dependent aminotransferase family protein n=1 Tax=Clostridium sp. TaxID=1506 RepID=UPI002FC68749
MNTPMIMTPGPTMVRENVRLSRSLECTNPDIDLNFKDFYINTCAKLASLIHTKNLVAILSGEAILGLEAACASLTEDGDRVLVLNNGVYGGGFKDFVSMYGGEAVVLDSSETEDFDISILEEYLRKDSNFKYATIVHCDTPSGVLNDVSKICPLLNKYGILSVVDSVSAIGGEEIHVDNWKMDIVIGGSQKAISAPAGLTIVSISDAAFKSMESRTTPIRSFYTNLLMWKTYKKDSWFPYTMPISDILGLNAAIDNIIEEPKIYERHSNIASALRKALNKSNLSMFLSKGFSNTVTAIRIPDSIDDKTLRNNLIKNHNIMIGGSVAYLEGKLIRIGHMGENSRKHYVQQTLNALQLELKSLGFIVDINLSEEFLKNLN